MTAVLAGRAAIVTGGSHGLGLEIARTSFLTSFPNSYLYREVTYPVVDLYFTADAIAPGEARSLDGVAKIEWHFPDAVPDEEIAFPSLRAALAAYRAAQ